MQMRREVWFCTRKLRGGLSRILLMTKKKYAKNMSNSQFGASMLKNSNPRSKKISLDLRRGNLSMDQLESSRQLIAHKWSFDRRVVLHRARKRECSSSVIFSFARFPSDLSNFYLFLPEFFLETRTFVDSNLHLINNWENDSSWVGLWQFQFIWTGKELVSQFIEKELVFIQ